MSLKETKCPNCHAQLAVQQDLPYMFCMYCGTKMYFHDEASAYDRTMHSYTSAVDRIHQLDYEKEKRGLELEQQKGANKRKQDTADIRWTFKLLLGVLLGLTLIILVGNAMVSIKTSIADKNAAPGTLKVPFSSRNLDEENRPYTVTVQQLEDVGFTDIHTMEIEDFITDSSRRNGSVYAVTFGGEDSFAKGDRFHKDIKVVVYYYAIPPE